MVAEAARIIPRVLEKVSPPTVPAAGRCRREISPNRATQAWSSAKNKQLGRSRHHYWGTSVATETGVATGTAWLRCRAQVDGPKPRPSAPKPDQHKLDKTGTKSFRPVRPTSPNNDVFSTQTRIRRPITSRDGAPPNLSVAGMDCARLVPLALPRFRPAIHPMGLEDLETTGFAGLPGLLRISL